MKEIIEKLKLKEDLSQREISRLLFESKQIYEERSADLGRWSREVISVVEIDNELYAITWWEGLTEMQDDYYVGVERVKLETEEVVVPQINIIYVEE